MIALTQGTGMTLYRQGEACKAALVPLLLASMLPMLPFMLSMRLCRCWTLVGIAGRPIILLLAWVRSSVCLSSLRVLTHELTRSWFKGNGSTTTADASKTNTVSAHVVGEGSDASSSGGGGDEGVAFTRSNAQVNGRAM